MFKNYIHTALRNLFRNRTYTIINIAGLAIGLAAFWLIAFFIADELSYDRFHTKAERIYRVVQHAKWDGGDLNLATTSAPFAPGLKAAFPEIQEAVRIVPEGGGMISYNQNTIASDDIVFADAKLFTVFDFPLLYGDAATALMKPDCIVLSEKLAALLFKDPSKALNQTIYFENNYPVQVTGIMKDIPSNSHLSVSGLRSLPAGFTSDWQHFNAYTYLLLREKSSYAKLEAKLPAFAAKTIQKAMGVEEYRMELQPLASIHLNSALQYEISANGNMARIYLFMIIAALILVIAIINYMNLATARASIRLKEVGVRKILGSGRKQLIFLFITEALLLTVFASCLAVVMVYGVLPMYNAILGKTISVWNFGMFNTLFILSAFTIFIGLLNGLYPAIILSRFTTISSLKGQMGNLANSILFRKSLVVFQFVITVVLIAGSIIVYKQMAYTRTMDLGFNKNQVLSFHIHDRNVRTQLSALKTQLLSNPIIEGAAAAGNPIGNNNLGSKGFIIQNEDGSFPAGTTMAQQLMIDEDYIPTLEIKLVAGRNFSSGANSDKYSGAIVNETLVKNMGWKNALGKRIRYNYGEGETAERTIVGVIKDFHTYSLHHKVDPMILLMPPAPSMEDNLYVKINTAKTAEAIAHLQNVYKSFDKNNPLEYHFLNENFARQYEGEEKQERLSFIFTMLAISIASLGLLGLATFTAQQRMKEIGIRKVLGANVTSIVLMLSKDLLILICIAACIAVPLAWFLLHTWLQNFAYRISLSWEPFAWAGIIAICFAFVTVSIQALKAASVNPVKSLRSE